MMQRASYSGGLSMRALVTPRRGPDSSSLSGWNRNPRGCEDRTSTCHPLGRLWSPEHIKVLPFPASDLEERGLSRLHVRV